MAYKVAGSRYMNTYNKLLNEYSSFDFIRECGIRVLLLECDEEKNRNGRRTYADCSKLTDKVSAIANCDFVITFYACDELDDNRLKILTYHEMKHIGCSPDGKLKIIPHDVEDFKDIIDEYGTDWVQQ